MIYNKYFKNYSLRLFLILFNLFSGQILFSGENTVVEFVNLPSRILEDLATYIDIYNDNVESLNKFTPYDPRIEKFPGKVIPLVIKNF